MLYPPFYDPKKSYEENLAHGPFGAFADGQAIKAKGEPRYDFFGHKLYSPFGIPAGPLPNGKFAKSALDKGFDIVVYKTVRTRQISSHPWPNILAVNPRRFMTTGKKERLVASTNYKEPLSITNSFGVPSANPEFWQKDIKDLVEETPAGQIVVGAFQGTKKENGNIRVLAEDFRLAAKLLKEAGVKVFEANLSCPNEGTDSLLCYDPEGSAEVIKEIKKEISNLPLIVKIGCFPDNASLRDFIKIAGKLADGISAINTIPAEIVDRGGKQALPGEGRLRSGVCGYAIREAGLQTVRGLKKLRDEFNYSYTIIGVGGVFNVADFALYREAGADIVLSATGAMWNPYLGEEIRNYLGK